MSLWTQWPDATHFQLLQDGEDDSAERDEYMEDDEKNLMRERIAKRLKKDASASVKSAGDGEKKPASRR
jgi:peptidyl-prolyl cis-trans isomerase SDCCAG10